MEEKMKNLFEYLKEIYELKTRVVLDYKKFDSEIDIEENSTNNIIRTDYDRDNKKLPPETNINDRYNINPNSFNDDFK